MTDRFAHQTTDEYAKQIPPQSWPGHLDRGTFQPLPMAIQCHDCHQVYRATNDYEQNRLVVAVGHMLDTGLSSQMLCPDCLAQRG